MKLFTKVMETPYHGQMDLFVVKITENFRNLKTGYWYYICE